MKRRNIPFNQELTIPYDDNLYYAEVHGFQYPSDYKDYSLTTEFSRIVIYDEEGNKLDKTHPHFTDLIEEVIASDIQNEYEEEGLDKFDCLD